MYHPFVSTLLRLVQLPLSLLNSDQSTLCPAVPGSQFKYHHACRAIDNFGSLSSYHDAPAFPEVSADLPDDCIVDQVSLLHRHGSRGPEGEERFIDELVNTLEDTLEAIQAAELPKNLEFLKNGYKSELNPGQLTAIGRKELFDHGVEFSLRYPTLRTDVLVSTTVQRVIDSAHYFADGFFGSEVDDITFLTTADLPDPVPWLFPWGSCLKMYPVFLEAYQASQLWAEKYVPPIVDRLNGLIPDVNFSLNDLRGALYACPYDLAAHGRSPWCGVFTADELRGLEYELDLSMDTTSGHASRGDPGPLLGAFYVKRLIERLTDETGNAEPLYLEFAHDLTIHLVLSTMNLNKDTVPLSPVCPPAYRKLRTSYQTPFAANMVWEKFTCQKSFKGPQVRLVLNGVTYPLSLCGKSGKDKKYGTCSLHEFVRAYEHVLEVEYHSGIWNATCEFGN